MLHFLRSDESAENLYSKLNDPLVGQSVRYLPLKLGAASQISFKSFAVGRKHRWYHNEAK